MVKSVDEGGMNVIDFEVMNAVIKLRWLQTFIKHEKCLWFNCLLPLPFWLLDYHMQVFLYWKMLYKHNYTPDNAPIWNNRYILYKRKFYFTKNGWRKEFWLLYISWMRMGIV